MKIILYLYCYMRFKIYLALIIATALFSCHKNEESVLLRLKYKKGDEKTFVIEQNASGSAYVNIHFQTQIAFTVDSVIKNGTEIIMIARLKSLKSDTKTGETIEHYDSNDKPQDMDEAAKEMDAKLQSSLNSYFDISFNDRGEVVKPFSASLKGVGEPIAPTDVQLVYPEQKVKIGDTWSDERENKLLSTTNKFTYAISDITKDNVIIHVAALIQGFKSLAKDANAEGEYIINRQNGQLISSRLDLPMMGGGRAVLSVSVKE